VTEVLWAALPPALVGNWWGFLAALYQQHRGNEHRKECFTAPPGMVPALAAQHRSRPGLSD
jgi:hypothetical protein